MDETLEAMAYNRLAKKRRAWIYCRVVAPDAYALRMQQEELSAFAEKSNYEVVGYTSEHDNGAKMYRPALAGITKAVLRGELDILLVQSLQRLGRDTLDTLEYVDWLSYRGVDVVCMNGGPSTQEVSQLLLTTWWNIWNSPHR